MKSWDTCCSNFFVAHVEQVDEGLVVEFKVHKKHVPGRAPPERPIISGSGSITEGISQFVQHHIQDLSVKHPSYIQDTPDVLRCRNDLENVTNEAILVTCDVSALYTNIQRHDMMELKL